MKNKKVIRLTESDLARLVKRVIKEENEETLRKQLHTLVGNEMRLGKRSDMSGGSEHHAKTHKEAEIELENFLKQNPSMMDYVEEVEDHFTKQLYR